MSIKFQYQIIEKDGVPTLFFGTDYNRARFKEYLKNNVGKYGTIEPREKITKESRGYFEGALVPAYLEWSDADPHSREQCQIEREIFKQEFNSKVVVGLHGEPVKIAMPTSDLSSEEFRDDFIAKIVEYFVEYGIPVPNPDLYKKWKDVWKDKYPLMSYWQFLQHFALKPDMGVEEVTYIIPVDTKKLPEYPREDYQPKFD